MDNIGMMKVFMLLGDLDIKQEDRLSDKAIAYNAKIASSTMKASIPNWQPPSNWNSLTNKEKLKRLDKLQSV